MSAVDAGRAANFPAALATPTDSRTRLPEQNITASPLQENPQSACTKVVKWFESRKLDAQQCNGGSADLVEQELLFLYKRTPSAASKLCRKCNILEKKWTAPSVHPI